MRRRPPRWISSNPKTHSAARRRRCTSSSTTTAQKGNLDEVSWDDDLNAGLIRLRVRAINHEKEAERFALGLYAATRKAVRAVGDGYFSGVLVELIRESDLATHPEIAAVMKHVHAVTPHREGHAFDRHTVCRELITDAISGRARELTECLQYSQEEAKQILVSALSRYLDERFAVTRRRESGLI